MDMTQVSPVLTLLLRRPDTEEMYVGELRGNVVVGGEAQPPSRKVVL